LPDIVGTFHVPYYEELMLAKDDEETRRVLLHCIHDEGDRICNLFHASDLDGHDPLVPAIRKLAFKYDRFIQTAKAEGLHAALLHAMDGLRNAYEQACDAYVSDPACAEASLTTRLLLRYDAFDEDDISDTELFRRSRESMLICRILEDYLVLLSIAHICKYRGMSLLEFLLSGDKLIPD
jgi:hypothetical protein